MKHCQVLFSFTTSKQQITCSQGLQVLLSSFEDAFFYLPFSDSFKVSHVLQFSVLQIYSLVSSDYPNCSLGLLDKLPLELR